MINQNGATTVAETSNKPQAPNDHFDDAKTQVGDLKSDLAQLRGDLKALAEDMSSLGKSSAGGAKQSVQESAQKWMDKAQEQVSESPLKTLGAAFAVGFILAKLTRH